MMTLHKVSAGSGYEYYTKEVASADERRMKDQSLWTEYYLATGTPAGIWMGNLRSHFDLGQTVDEQEMKDLFGCGKRPDAQKIRDKKNGIVDEKAFYLGQKYQTFSERHEAFRSAVTDAVSRAHAERGMLGTNELQQVRLAVGKEWYMKERGTVPNGEQLGRYVASLLSPDSSTVAGFDLTFSPPKSVSVLWALGDRDLQTVVEDAHTKATERALGYLERDVLASRAGKGGVRRADIEGILAARFRHYDSRNGDPQLHDHVVVSNKVFCPSGSTDEKGKPKGKWRSIDARGLYKAAVAASEWYDTALIEELQERLGVEFEARQVRADAPVKMEVRGVSDEVIAQFSTRRTHIEEVLERLVHDYEQAHGYAPSKKTKIALAQQATLQTRSEKDHVPLPERVQQWRNACSLRFTAADFAASRNPVQVFGVDEDALAKQTINALKERRGSWTVRNIEAEVARQLQYAHGAGGLSTEHIGHVTKRVITSDDVVQVTVEKVPLTRLTEDKNGKSVYEFPEATTYTTKDIIEAEQHLLEATAHTVIPVCDAVSMDKTLRDFESLSVDQRLFVEHLALSDKLIATGVGAAGSGKTTSMEALVSVVSASGGRIFGVAPSAAAAAELQNALGIEAMTAHRWLASPHREKLRPGDMVLVDEAGMMDLTTLGKITDIAASEGGVLRLIGDPHQLQAVDNPGMFRLIHNAACGVELETIWRFRTPGEAEASLQLRAGDEQSLTWYEAQERLKGLPTEDVLTGAFDAWSADVLAGKTSLLLAGTTENVDQLNLMAQTFMLTRGYTTPADHEVEGRDSHTLHVGDLIVTRKNDASNRYGKDVFVKNGDSFTVVSAHADGSLDVATSTGVVLTLDAAYVKDYVELGYASTVYRAQGRTVDTSHTVIDEMTSRENLYVGMTRGKDSNTAWVGLGDSDSLHETLTSVLARHAPQLSAHEAIATNVSTYYDPAHAWLVYHDLSWRADNGRWKRRLDDLTKSGRVDPLVATAHDAPSWMKLVSRFNALEQEGIAPERVLQETCHALGVGAEHSAEIDVAQLVDQRMHIWHEDNQKRVETANAKPSGKALVYQDMSWDQLVDAYRQQQQNTAYYAERARWEDTCQEVQVGDTTHPSWHLRPYGKTPDQALSRAYMDTHTRLEVARVTENKVEEARLTSYITALEDERAMRASMSRVDKQREDHGRLIYTTATTDPNYGGGREQLPYQPVLWKNITGERESIEAEMDRRALLHKLDPLPDGLSYWTAPRGAIMDEATSKNYRIELEAARAHLAECVTYAGHKTSSETWARGTKQPSFFTDEEWTRQLGELKTWREVNKVRPDTPASGLTFTPAAEQNAFTNGINDQEIERINTRISTTQPPAKPRTPEVSPELAVLIDAAKHGDQDAWKRLPTEHMLEVARYHQEQKRAATPPPPRRDPTPTPPPPSVPPPPPPSRSMGI